MAAKPLPVRSAIFPVEEQILVGVDIGGTHTAAVVMQNNAIISRYKTITTSDITQGILQIFQALFKDHTHLVKNKEISISIGTTQLVNALIQGTDLLKTLVIRLAAPLTDALPPTVDWSEENRSRLGKYLTNCLIIKGGYEYQAKGSPEKPKEVSPLDCDEIKRLANETLSNGTQAVAITGLFSKNTMDQEEKVAAIFKEINPSLHLSLSHKAEETRAGLLYRENATIINALLALLLKKIFETFKRSIADFHITTKNLYLTQGDGTKIRIDDDLPTPLLILDSGSINSVKGAAYLANVEDAVTVDIGGTSTDLGILKKGIPLKENAVFKRGGINLSFRCFRSRSYALGGGTSIKIKEPNRQIQLGPESVENELSIQSLVYGGSVLTPADVAFFFNRINLEKTKLDRASLQRKIQEFSPQENFEQFIQRIDDALHKKLVDNIIDSLGALENIPTHLILVGEGAKLFDIERLKHDPLLKRFTTILIPPNAEIASAIGAAKSLDGATSIRTSKTRIGEIKTLTTTDIDNIALAAGMLGSGGGGDSELARLMTVNAIKEGKKVNIMPIDALSDNANVVVCVGVGSPDVLYERLFTRHEGRDVLKTLEKELDKKIDAVIAGEAGGTNVIYPLFIGANEDIPIVDADCAGRCLPQLQMMTPNIYGEIKKTKFVLSNGIENKIIEAEDLADLESKARVLTVQMGSVVSMALVPMTGAQVKAWAIKGTISLLQEMGKAINKERSFSEKLNALNEVLIQTEYKEAKKVAEGEICGFKPGVDGGFSKGGFLIKNLSKPEELLEVGFQNENIVARWRKEQKIIESNVPHLITIVEQDTFKVISCEQLCDGLNVAVLILTAPEKLLTDKAMELVGPQAYQFDDLLKFLDTLSETE